MERVILDVQVRDELGKAKTKKLRDVGLIPAVVYRRGENALALKVNGQQLNKILHGAAGEHAVIDLKISGGKKKTQNKTVIIKEVQHHPARGDVLHVDFHQISLTETIEVNVPVSVKGESAGVKQGGVLEHHLWELQVECLPTNLPDKIEIDISQLGIGDSIHVKEIVPPPGVKILTDAEMVVISCLVPAEEKAEEVAPEEEVTEEAAEPEVIRQKKEVEEREGEEKAS